MSRSPGWLRYVGRGVVQRVAAGGVDLLHRRGEPGACWLHTLHGVMLYPSRIPRCRETDHLQIPILNTPEHSEEYIDLKVIISIPFQIKSTLS